MIAYLLAYAAMAAAEDVPLPTSPVASDDGQEERKEIDILKEQLKESQKKQDEMKDFQKDGPLNRSFLGSSKLSSY